MTERALLEGGSVKTCGVVLQPLETYIAKESTKGNPFRGWQYLDHRHYPTILRTKCLLDLQLNPSNPKGPSDPFVPISAEISFSFLWSYEHVSYRQVREWGCFCIFLAGFTNDMHHRERCGIFPLKPLEVWSIHTCTRKISNSKILERQFFTKRNSLEMQMRFRFQIELIYLPRKNVSDGPDGWLIFSVNRWYLGELRSSGWPMMWAAKKTTLVWW